MKKDLYTDGFIINYPEGDNSLERKKLTHNEDLNDRIHVIREGDNLTRIAYNYYGDPLKWFLIADANEIENPLLLTIGSNLVIPSLDKYDL